MKKININELNEILNNSDVLKESTEYSFLSNYMYQETFSIKKHNDTGIDFLILEYDDLNTMFLPLINIYDVDKFIALLREYQNDNKDRKLVGVLRDKDVILLNERSENISLINRDSIREYIYDAEKLRTLSGRKYSKKRNHLKSFFNTYNGRYQYKLLNTKEDFESCRKLLLEWGKDVSDKEDVINENRAINIIFDNYELIKENLKIAGVYIDKKLEAFTIGSKVNKDMVIIHIEKANHKIKGLYQYINREFLIREFPEVLYVNREEDMGIEGLKKSKMSYYPIRFINKYDIKIN